MFTHIVVRANDPAASAKFYDATFAALGIAGGLSGDSTYYGGYEGGFFSVGPPRDGEAATFANGGSNEGAPGRCDMGDNKLAAFTTNVSD